MDIRPSVKKVDHVPVPMLSAQPHTRISSWQTGSNRAFCSAFENP